MTRAMIHAKALPVYFRAGALDTASHIHNWVTLLPGTTCINYELWKGRKPNVKYFHMFGSTCFILSDRDQYRKWDSKFNRGIFLGYLTNHKAYRIYNQRTKTVMESINVIVDDDNYTIKSFRLGRWSLIGRQVPSTQTYCIKRFLLNRREVVYSD